MARIIEVLGVNFSRHHAEKLVSIWKEAKGTFPSYLNIILETHPDLFRNLLHELLGVDSLPVHVV